MQADVQEPRQGCLRTLQGKAAAFYSDTKVQVVVAFLISANFLTNIVEKEVDPLRADYLEVWLQFELVYNVIFSLELLVNMFGNWFKAFWTNGWNVFDFVVVAIGLLDAFKVDLPEPLKMLRMMRAFRVFRLFRKIKSLNKIVVSLVHAIPGMMNAFFINLLFMCIYAVLAVDFFGHAERVRLDCEQLGEKGQTLTGRGICHGQEYYSTFARSLYTLFQVLSGDSWSEAVVRPIFYFFEGEPLAQFFTGIFFVSFILINSIILINVVVAVLLDKMADNGSKDAEADDTASSVAKDIDGADLPSGSTGGEKVLQAKDLCVKIDHSNNILKDAGQEGLNSPSASLTEVAQLREEVRGMSHRMGAEIESSRKNMEALSQQVACVLGVMEHIRSSHPGGRCKST